MPIYIGSVAPTFNIREERSTACKDNRKGAL